MPKIVSFAVIPVSLPDEDPEWKFAGQNYPKWDACILALKADDPKVLFVATGDGAIGSTGAIQRSKDGGQSWQMMPLPIEPNSPIWAFATHRAQPDRILACSHYGELFASHDAGDSWVKLRREFAETRALTWTPN